MSNNRVFARTRLGNELLDDPKGRISGDELLLIAMIDGKTSIDGIAQKVPPSVRVNLDAIFAHLLSAKFIEDSHAFESPAEQDGKGQKDRAAKEKSGAELEAELAGVRAQLEAARAKQKEIEVGFHKLRLRVSTYAEVRLAKLVSKLHNLEAKTMTAEEVRANYAGELKDALDSLQPLSQAVAELQLTLDQTLRMKLSQTQQEQLQKERESETAKMAQVHPHYKKLRGLDFFKGFANAEMMQFLKIAKWQEAAAGETVLNEGDVGMPFFIIVSGRVAVSKGNFMLATLGQGDFFGEFAYLSGEEPYRSARVDAESTCEFLMIDPLDIEFAPMRLRLQVVEALLRGQVRRTMISSRPIDSARMDEKHHVMENLSR
ncbi:MAG TPA: cyclic nucleotide-binding domain-containing protein [Gallionella sp.]